MMPNLAAPRYWPCRNPCPDSVGIKMRRTRYALKELALDATKYLTDRMFGKASQAVDLNHSGDLSLTLAETIRKARQRLL